MNYNKASRHVSLAGVFLTAVGVLLTGCGPRYRTASELRNDLGEPCTVEGNLWTYCAARCGEEWCRGECSEGCSPRWRMRVVDGIIVDTLEAP